MTERELFEAKLRTLLQYDAASGVLSWKTKPNSSIRVGTAVGSANSWGHLKFATGGRTLMVHRVAWFLYHGEWPKQQIDHIDGDKTNNRMSNLRDVSQALNMQNQKAGHRGSRSGLLGVHFNPNSKRNPWESKIKANGKNLYLGKFKTAEDAHAAYLKVKATMHDTGSAP